MTTFLDRCIWVASSAGTGSFVESAAVTGFQTMEAAGALDQQTFDYAAQSADLSQWEVGNGTWTAGTKVLTRTVVYANNLGGTSAINFNQAPRVMITVTAQRVGSQNPTVQTFLSGSGTYTTPAGVKWIRVRMVGGGAGGAGGGSAGGTAPTSGGNTTFGSNTAGGGVFQTWANQEGGLGGTATLAGGFLGIAVNGGEGGTAINLGAGVVQPVGSQGGSSALGGSAAGGTSSTGDAGAANTGGGGGGGGCNTSTGDYGGPGGGAGAYIDAIATSPAATYSYGVGTGGNAGGAGTNGSAGGAGGSGAIYVEEYYGY